MRRFFLLLAIALPLGAGPELLVDRWNEFAKTGNKFADQCRRGVFDLRLARKLSAEWREIEKSGEWPR